MHGLDTRLALDYKSGGLALAANVLETVVRYRPHKCSRPADAQRVADGDDTIRVAFFLPCMSSLCCLSSVAFTRVLSGSTASMEAKFLALGMKVMGDLDALAAAAASRRSSK